MKLFDFLKVLFSSKGYNELSGVEKGRQFFMVNRFMAIKYPLAANMFNHLQINAEKAVDCWHDSMKAFKQIPPWLWQGVKGKKAKKQDNPLNSFDKSIIDKYMELNGISYKEMDRLVELYPKELYDELKAISISYINKIYKK